MQTRLSAESRCSLKQQLHAGEDAATYLIWLLMKKWSALAAGSLIFLPRR